MSRIRVLWKAFKVSIKIKGPASMAISLLGFPAALLPILLADLLRRLTDELQLLMGTGGSAAPAMTIFAYLICAHFAQVVITNIGQYASGMNEVKIKRFIRRTIMRHKCEVRYKYIENYYDFQKRLTLIEEYAGREMARCMESIITILQLFLAMFGVSAALWHISPLITVVLFVTSIPAAILAYLQQEETLRGRAKWMDEGALAIHYFHVLSGDYTMDGYQEIRHFGLFSFLKAQWRSVADVYIEKKNEILFKHVKYNTAADFLRNIVYVGILLIAAQKIYQNPEIGLGVFTLVFTLSGQLQTIAADCFVDSMVLYQSIPLMNEFFYLDDLERERYQDGGMLPESGDIVFDHVHFSYPNADTDVLKNITIHIRDGEKVAIVGENGSGKSTFISLLCGMFDPKSGAIKVGGIKVSEFPAVVRRMVSVVFQDFARYEATLRENISVSDKQHNRTDEEIMALLRMIHVDDVIEEQPNGLEELVGSFSDKANNLSGGQWQKISIARAAYRQDAKIMILDEPTSALDPVAEAQLYRNYADLTGDKTTILISHRLGITAIVDRILVFHEGEIVEDGSHEELMKEDKLYARMYRAQAAWYQ